MNQIEARAELVKRLRSGQVAQTKHVLGRIDGRRCCLGVACDIAAEAGVVTAIERAVTLVEGGAWAKEGEVLRSYDGEVYSLPLSVKQFFGFTTSIGVYEDGVCSRASLAVDNDKGLTFDEIADIIESNPTGLFKQS